MKSKKINLSNLKVKSFVTTLDDKQEKPLIVGGADTNNKPCAISVWLCASENVCPSLVSACITNRC